MIDAGEPHLTCNINQIEFCIFGKQGMEKFAFAYDDLNRLTQMYYPPSAVNDENDFDVAVGYADVIGNIG